MSSLVPQSAQPAPAAASTTASVGIAQEQQKPRDVAFITGPFTLAGVLLTFIGTSFLAWLTRRADNEREKSRRRFDRDRLTVENAKRLTEALTPMISQIRSGIVSTNDAFIEYRNALAELRNEVRWAEMFPSEDAEKHFSRSVHDLKQASQKLAANLTEHGVNAVRIYDKEVFMAEIYMLNDEIYKSKSSELRDCLLNLVNIRTRGYEKGRRLDRYLEHMRQDATEKGIKLSNLKWTNFNIQPSEFDQIEGDYENVLRDVDGILEDMRSRLVLRTVPE